MVFEYAQLRGTLDGMDTTVITELAEYYEKEIGCYVHAVYNMRGDFLFRK